MRIKRLPIFALLILIIGTISPVYAQVQANVDDRGIPTIAPLLEKVTPAVVNITVVSQSVAAPASPLTDPFFEPFFSPLRPQQPQRQVSAGSGVIVDAEKGYVLTNNHVVRGGGQVTVTLKDKRSFDAQIVGTDPATDIAVLQIDADGLSALPLGDSEELLVGDFVVAVGNPFGLGQTVTSGIISALGRSGINPQGYEDFIQTDASINPGNSGGALVTFDGKLIGINTAIIAPSGGNVGIGFAIPVNMARAVMDQLISFGEVQRGILGVTTQDLTPEIAAALGLDATEGALVVQVEPGSAAEKAGLQPGDLIIGVNGESIADAKELRGHLGVMRSGTDFKMTILRSDGKHQLTARLSQAQNTHQIARSRILAGAVLAPLERGMPGFGQVRGVSVRDVAPGSPAARFGLRSDDVIMAVNRKPVETVEALDRVLAQSGGTIAMLIWRQGTTVYLLIRP